VVAPASEVPAVVHLRNGFDITFWRYHRQPADRDAPPAMVASALRRLHEAYAQTSVELRGSLPSYLAERESVADLLRDGRRLAVHVVELEGGSWRASLAFRDALRADESLRAEYLRMKEHAVALAPAGRARYNELKHSFIERSARGR
jgi:GrpB-like predicted nucleotidyltransferase (UPF0157 family)